VLFECVYSILEHFCIFGELKRKSYCFNKTKEIKLKKSSWLLRNTNDSAFSQVQGVADTHLGWDMPPLKATTPHCPSPLHLDQP
jgi:hypothetical protein